MSVLAAEVGAILLRRGESLAVAESCTGGLIAKRVTDVAGSSGWFDCGLVTYSNRAKQQLLGVPDAVLASDGAVSLATVRAMVQGVLRGSPANWGIAVTGIAGPDGGSRNKPVGTVWLSWQRRGFEAEAQRFQFAGNREQVREQAAQTALEQLLRRLRDA
ncbi:MAG: CinA family protein [Stenotrophobium sp.]